MPVRSAYEYVVIRVVPEVMREEFINAGVILFCRTRRFLDLRLHLDEARLLALAPAVDVPAVREQLDMIAAICAGGEEAGPIGRLPQPERFRWLAAPRNTVVQMSPVHGGLCDDPAAELNKLFRKTVC
jgi:hypothetical protein